MKRKNVFFTGVAVLCVQGAMAQITAGESGLTVLSGTTLTVDSLVLIPSVDLTIESNTIVVSRTAIPGQPKNSVSRVYQSGSPIVFRGLAGFFFDDNELNGNTVSDLALVYNSSTTNAGFISTSPSSASMNFVSHTFGQEVTLQQVTAAAPASALPVSLTGFSVKADGRKARVEWETVWERNNRAFRLDRSTDAVQFSPFATIPGKGTTTGRERYLVIDDSPGSGVTYYRLRQIDQDGTEKDYGTRSVEFKLDEVKLAIYPNPATSHLSLVLPDARERSLQVDWTDSGTGKRVAYERVRSVSRETVLQVPGNLSSGVYVVQVSGDGMLERIRVVVHR